MRIGDLQDSIHPGHFDERTAVSLSAARGRMVVAKSPHWRRVVLLVGQYRAHLLDSGGSGEGRRISHYVATPVIDSQRTCHEIDRSVIVIYGWRPV